MGGVCLYREARCHPCLAGSQHHSREQEPFACLPCQAVCAQGPWGREEVLAPQSEHGSLRLLEGSWEGVVFELNFEERIRFFDRLWLGGWRTNDFAAAGSIMSKGMETGNCKTCPASALVWLKRRSQEQMQWDLGQNHGLRVDSGGLCTLSKECFWGSESL